MKTNYFIKLTLMMAFTPIIFASCSKTDSEPAAASASTVVNSQNGVIFDKGSTDAGFRHMQVVLNKQSYNTINNNGEVKADEAVISVVFYTNADRQVPSGVYNYSDSPGNEAFGNALLFAVSDSYSASPPISSIASGSIKVTNDNSQYHLTFNCVLSTGELFKSDFQGVLSYFDN